MRSQGYLVEMTKRINKPRAKKIVVAKKFVVLSTFLKNGIDNYRYIVYNIHDNYNI